MPKTIPSKWRNQDWNLHPLYKIMLPSCHRWAPWLSQEKDNLRTAIRKARIGALLKSPGLVENRDRKRLALALHTPRILPHKRLMATPLSLLPVKAEGTTSRTPCRGVLGAQGGAQRRTIEPFSKLGTGSWGAGRGGRAAAETEPSPPSPSGEHCINKRWLWGQQHGEGPLLPLPHSWSRLSFWAKIPQIRTVGAS